MSSHFTNARHAVALTDQELRAIAPSVFALEPWQEVSDRYRFIPTIDVVNKMRAEGFVPVAAKQGRVRTLEKADFTMHMLRFRRLQDLQTSFRQVGDEIIELVLRNAHDRSSAYQLDGGIFRLACLNGLVVSSGQVQSVRATHSGSKDLAGQVIDASFQIVEQAPVIMGQIADMRSTLLSRGEQTAFATAALELRESALALEPEQVLRPKRHEDNVQSDGKRSLWATMNVVQEHLLRGGVRGRDANNRPRKTRAISSITEDLRLNKALWRLAEEMKKATALPIAA